LFKMPWESNLGHVARIVGSGSLKDVAGYARLLIPSERVVLAFRSRSGRSSIRRGYCYESVAKCCKVNILFYLI
jgi:hypothetical protein